jgi:hypothetical protein
LFVPIPTLQSNGITDRGATNAMHTTNPVWPVARLEANIALKVMPVNGLRRLRAPVVGERDDLLYGAWKLSLSAHGIVLTWFSNFSPVVL